MCVCFRRSCHEVVPIPRRVKQEHRCFWTRPAEPSSSTVMGNRIDLMYLSLINVFVTFIGKKLFFFEVFDETSWIEERLSRATFFHWNYSQVLLWGHPINTTRWECLIAGQCVFLQVERNKTVHHSITRLCHHVLSLKPFVPPFHQCYVFYMHVWAWVKSQNPKPKTFIRHPQQSILAFKQADNLD